MTQKTRKALSTVTRRLKALPRQEAIALLDQHRNGDVARALLHMRNTAGPEDQSGFQRYP